VNRFFIKFGIEGRLAHIITEIIFSDRLKGFGFVCRVKIRFFPLTVSEMTYTVSSWTLNSTIPYHSSH